MEISQNSIFYFGTDKKTYSLIKEKGISVFYNFTRNFDAWLGDFGIYLSKRPGVAYHFANQKASKEEFEDKVLIEATLKIDDISANEILDLTTETGMYKLWSSYLKLNKRLFGNPYYGTSTKSKTSKKNKKTYEQDHNSKLNLYNKKMNLDCMAITDIITDDKVNLIIGFFQEGSSFARTLTTKKIKKHKNIPSYKGILSRDHIEICVVKPSFLKIKREMTEDDLFKLIEAGNEISKSKYMKFITSSIGFQKDFN